MTTEASSVLGALRRAATALEEGADHLTELDQAVGDGDLGITAGNIARALREAADAASSEPEADLGKLVAKVGMAVNRAASSSFGTLFATALMRAGKAARGKERLDAETLADMFDAADEGLQERGKARPGDKTVIDVVNPAAAAFREAVSAGQPVGVAAARALEAGQQGLDAVTPLQSKIGRAGWVGERTKGQVDPGGAAGLLVLRAVAQVED